MIPLIYTEDKETFWIEKFLEVYLHPTTNANDVERSFAKHGVPIYDESGDLRNLHHIYKDFTTVVNKEKELAYRLAQDTFIQHVADRVIERLLEMEGQEDQ